LPIISPGLPGLQQAKKIRSLAEKLTAIKASRNWFRDRYHWASSYFKANNIPFPYPWKAVDLAPPVAKLAPVGDPASNAVREIQQCLVDNLSIRRKQRRYTNVYKLFSLSVFSFSTAAYAFLRHFLPLPCPRVLRNEFGRDIQNYGSELRDVEAIPAIIAARSWPRHLPCTLCVDAFSVDIFKSKLSPKPERAAGNQIGALSAADQMKVIAETVRAKTGEQREVSQDNSIFLFLLAPVDIRFPIFPIHLKAHRSGSADSEIQQLTVRIINQLTSSDLIDLAFVSVDGDAGYQSFFDNQFGRLFPQPSPVLDIQLVLGAFHQLRARQIGDFLHFLKNARTRIDQKTVHCICSPLRSGVCLAELSRIFGPVRFLTDFSPLGRMRDSYPLSLFTIQNALFAATCNGPDAFIYLLVYALWQESLLNKELSTSMRLFMLKVVFYFMYEIHSAIQALKARGVLRVTEKKTTLSCEVTFAALPRLKRMILTVLGQMDAIVSFPENLGLDRIGSHVEENSIGIIRQHCFSNNQSETVFRAVARLEFVKVHLSSFGYCHQISSRANLGGVRLTEEGISTVPTDLSPLQVVQGVLSALGCDVRRTDVEIISFSDAIQWIIDLAVQAPIGPSHFCGDASGSQILARLIAFRPEGSSKGGEQTRTWTAERRTTTWSPEELTRLMGAMGQGMQDLNDRQPLFPKKSPRCLWRKFRELLRFESSRRPWTHDEDECLVRWVQAHGKRWREAEAEFKWRTDDDLRKRCELLSVLPRTRGFAGRPLHQ
jgi:hypothetical protein